MGLAMPRGQFLIYSLASSLAVTLSRRVVSCAEIDFFQTPAEQNKSSRKNHRQPLP